MNWPSGGWIKANKDQQSFYRVNYEVSNWLGIVDYLKNNNSRTWVRWETKDAAMHAALVSPADISATPLFFLHAEMSACETNAVQAKAVLIVDNFCRS